MSSPPLSTLTLYLQRLKRASIVDAEIDGSVEVRSSSRQAAAERPTPAIVAEAPTVR